MKGNERIIATLNDRLIEELTAVNQYFVHAEMCENWGYDRLHGMTRKRSIDEMKHAEKLIARILFLEGHPVVSTLNKMHIGSEIARMHESDKNAETVAVQGYNQSIRLAVELGDNGTREILEEILVDEEAHLNGIEAQLEQIRQMGLENYLIDQVR